MQILKEEEEDDAKLVAGCGEKRKELANRWQCDTKVQDLNDKPWKNEEMKNSEEDVPRFKEGDVERAARNCKAKTGVGCDGFHPKVPLGLAKHEEKWRRSWRRWHSVGGACTTMFLLIPKNVTSERPTELMLTMIRWWEAL